MPEAAARGAGNGRMATSALALTLLYVALAFGARTILQLRSTGGTGRVGTARGKVVCNDRAHRSDRRLYSDLMTGKVELSCDFGVQME